jgi:probable F420-dependent oxidoreductase
VKISVGLPTGMEGLMYPVPFSTPKDIVDIAIHAERLGYHSVWGNDHMTTQHYVRKEFSTPPNYWEPLITYGFIAAATKTLRMGTGMLVLPMRRDIVVTAKQIATLDQFSGGRIEIGLGVGAYREEFEALQPHFKAHRGNMVDEGLSALRQLFTERQATHEGEYYQYRDVEMFPKPLQKELPLYLGGNNINAIMRAAKAGNGWMPACVEEAKLRESVKVFHDLAERHGRDISTLEVAPQYIVYLGKTREQAIEKFKQSQMYNHLVSLGKSTLKDQGQVAHEDINLVGDAQHIIDLAARLKAAGATHLLGLYFAVNTMDELMDQMQAFAEQVMPHLMKAQ